MISYHEALELIYANAKEHTTEYITLSEACGRVCAESVISKINLPPFNNSAMDGFAVRFSDTLEANVNSLIKLQVGSVLPAGSNLQDLKLADCVAIMTGAPVPECYDAVIPVENVTVVHENNERYILISEPIKQYANLRFAGEDVPEDGLILSASQKIRPQDIMLLAACGVASICVYSQIKILLAPSGEELSEQYDKPLNFGEIYNSNAPLLQNLANTPAFLLKYHGIIRDNKEELITLISQADAQIIITTGAVSMGEWDFIPAALKELGAEIIFHKTAIRPGKPILFAKLPNGSYFFGLPGNPVASFVGWRFFVLPLIRKTLCQDSEKSCIAIVQNQFHKKHKLRQFLKANLVIDNGVAKVTISSEQESFKIAALTKSNTWVISHEEQQINAGDMVEFVPLIPEV